MTPGDYAFRETQVSYRSSAGRRLSGRLTLTGGGYYGGAKTTIGLGAHWRPSPRLALDTTLDRNDMTLRGRSFRADVFGGRVQAGLSTIFFASGFLQYNAAAGQAVVNFRLDYIHSPLSDFFVAYTERRSTQGAGDVLERVFSVKLTKMLAF